MMICVECWEPLEGHLPKLEHAERHLVGTEHIAVKACICIEKETGLFHPVHKGRCNMPTGHLGVVSCYCTRNYT